MTVTHHLYRLSDDLLPTCGVTPGPDAADGRWHTGHEARVLFTHAAPGDGC